MKIFLNPHVPRFEVQIRSVLRNSITWSPLAQALNEQRSNKKIINVLKNKGLFGIPELKKYQGFYTLKDQCIAAVNKLTVEALGTFRNRKIVEIFDELSDTLCKVADLAEFIRVTHPHQPFVYTADIACTSVAAVVEKLNTNVALYMALKNVVVNGDLFPLNDMDRHVAQLFLFDFEQSGIHLEETERNTIVSLNEKMLYIGQLFMIGTSKPRIIDKKFVPEYLRNYLNMEGDKITVSGFESDSSDTLTRELTYKMFFSPDEEQEVLLNELLATRNKLAKICGFDSYSTRVLKNCIFSNPDSVVSFLKDLSKAIQPHSLSEFKIMSEVKMKDTPNAGPLAMWDVPYYTQSIKKNLFDLSQSTYNRYLSLGACMEGLNNIFSCLFGISLENEELNYGEAWAADIYKLAVKHESEGILGYIYCDFYERFGKMFQESHYTIKGGRLLPDGTYQLPVVAVVLSLPAPAWGIPSLLNLRMLDNLYHEMGHALHSMLGRTKYQHVTGTRCSTDFAEVPSILMEYFASDSRVIKTFARHYKTRIEIPDCILNKICSSRNIFVASEMQLQILYSLIDQIYHGIHPLNGTTTSLLREAQNEYYQLPCVENTAWQLRNGHLVSYGAKYYSYIVSKAIASCIWQTYFEKDPFSRFEGERYRNECLSYGGSKPAFKLLTDYLKIELTSKHLIDFLIKEIEVKSENFYTKLKL